MGRLEKGGVQSCLTPTLVAARIWRRSPQTRHKSPGDLSDKCYSSVNLSSRPEEWYRVSYRGSRGSVRTQRVCHVRNIRISTLKLLLVTPYKKVFAVDRTPNQCTYRVVDQYGHQRRLIGLQHDRRRNPKVSCRWESSSSVEISTGFTHTPFQVTGNLNYAYGQNNTCLTYK